MMTSQQVMLLEDDPIIQWDLEQKLRSINCHVAAQYDRSDDYISDRSCPVVDIIITNLRLEDGWVSVDALEFMSHSSKGLLILTGLGDEAYYDLTSITGPHAVLVKPYTRHQLRQSISEIQKAS